MYANKRSLFGSIPVKKLKRTAFDLSHHNKLTCGFGQLVPFLCESVVPGDRFKVRTESFVRMMALQSPIMHNVNLTIHYFFVPYRLVWDQWEDFYSSPNATDEDENLIVKPHFTAPSTAWKAGALLGAGTLADYLNLHVGDPENVAVDIEGISQLPFRAYQLIYDEYYRDQNLIEPVTPADGWPVEADTTDSDDAELFKLRQRAFMKDEFTSALPDPQAGPDVTLPVQGEAELILKDQTKNKTINMMAYDFRGTIGVPEGGLQAVGMARSTAYSGIYSGVLKKDGELDSDAYSFLDIKNAEKIDKHVVDNVGVNLESATAVNINDLRRAERLQEFLELIARTGKRYIERIRGEFGVNSGDARLQRPEYLGGGITPIIVSEVAQTSASDNEPSPLGNLAGKGVGLGNRNNFDYFCPEFGMILGIMSITPDSSYQQGISPFWFKNDMLDYYHPKFAHLGEQEIRNYQLFAGTANDNDVFGYTPRYAEYKYHSSEVHGEMLSSLSFWHLGRIFDQLPGLNKSFVQVPSDAAGQGLNRIFADESSTQNFIVELYLDEKAVRPMPRFGVPKL